MNESLTPKLEKFAREKVEEGLYQTTSEVIREGLRLLMEKEQRYQLLKNEVLKGHQQVLDGKTVRVESREQFLETICFPAVESARLAST